MASERNLSVKPYINLREKLAQNFAAHPQVGLYLRRHTAVIDKFVKDCAAFAKVPTTCAIAALGGYGRREMFPYSDIDLAVLTPEDISEADQTAIAEFVTALWSLGLTVGTNVRTKAETLKITASDITAATAFLEARSTATRLSLRTLTRPFFVGSTVACSFAAKCSKCGNVIRNTATPPMH